MTSEHVLQSDQHHGPRPRDAAEAQADHALQHALALNALLKFRRDFSHAVLLNLVTPLARRHEIIERWFLISGRADHLFLAAVRVLGASITLYLVRRHDRWSPDKFRAGRSLIRTGAGRLVSL
jgi:hypothetical protein